VTRHRKCLPANAALHVLIFLLAAGCGEEAAPPSPPSVSPDGPTAPPSPAPPTSEAPPPLSMEELAEQLLARAEMLERNDPRGVLDRYREIRVRFAATEPARRAERGADALLARIRAEEEADFLRLDGEIRTLADEGRYREALSRLQDGRDPRAATLAAEIDNRARTAFNRAVDEDSPAVLRALRDRLPEHLATLCDQAIESLHERAGRRKEQESLRNDYERRLRLLEEAKGAWPLLASRRYEEVLRTWRGEVGDRELIRAAAEFWGAFLKGRDASVARWLKTAEGKEIVSRAAEVPVESLHRDSIAALALSELPADDARTYVKSAMWHWFEGQSAAALRELATAKERGDVAPVEEAFRNGWLRAALGP